MPKQKKRPATGALGIRAAVAGHRRRGSDAQRRAIRGSPRPQIACKSYRRRWLKLAAGYGALELTASLLLAHRDAARADADAIERCDHQAYGHVLLGLESNLGLAWPAAVVIGSER